MVVVVADVKKLLPVYQGLTTDQIESAIESAEAYLDGIDADWRDFPKADTIHTFASAALTLQLHFPTNVSAFTTLDNKVMEMVQSVWNSANMIKRKTRFARCINVSNDE